MKKNNHLRIVTTIVCLLPIILSCFLYDKLPQQMPIHFDNAGVADNYLPKAVFTFALPIGLALLNLYVHFTLDNNLKKNLSAVMQTISYWAVPIVSILGVSLSIYIALK